ncbi:hypothetical protein Tco_0965776 [Tanacetum coccineum]
MDANKKIDLDNPLYPNESEILANILQNHPHRFSIAASSSVPWIYLGQFWHTLKEDGSKYRLTFVLDRKELIMTLDDFKTIFQLPQAKNNNHEHFCATPKCAEKNVKEHLAAEEIEKMVEGTKNVDADEFVNSILNSQNDPGTRLDSGSYNESPEVEITAVVQPMNVTEEEDELAEDDYELRRRVKGKHVEESRNTPSPTPIRSPRIHSTLMSSDTEKLQELTLKVAQKVADAIQKERENLRAEITWQINNVISNHIPSQVDSSVRSYITQDQVEGPIANNTSCRSSANRPRDQDDHYDDSHPEGENSAKRQKISEHGTYVIGESSFGQADKSDPSPSTSSNQEQLDDFDFWTDKYATDDDELPAETVSQELVKEMSETVDEAKLRKVVGEMMR